MHAFCAFVADPAELPGTSIVKLQDALKNILKP